MIRGRVTLATCALLVLAAFLLAAGAAPGASGIVGAASVNKMLRGVPQQGIELGKPNAPVTLVEIVEPQCPGCAIWARDELPGVISRYVRGGKVRIEYRGISFLGSDSDNLLALAQAAGEQSKLWSFVELAYANQGAEGSGYADRAYLTAIAGAVPGLDVNKAFAGMSSGKVAARIARAQALSDQYGIKGTPSLLIGKTGDEKNMTVMADMYGQSLYASIDAALAGKPVSARSAGLPAWAMVLIIMAGTAALGGVIAALARLSERRSAPPPAG
ncbi:MAG: DsbA family protein [Gaiellaceae bacterium]